MIRADYKDKQIIVDILTSSFLDNKSVNYIIKQDNRRLSRVRNLMDYSFEVCHSFGYVFLSNDKTACALIVLPERKKTSLRSVFLDIKLIFYCIGIANIGKTITRESKIKSLRPTEPMYYLWFIGTDPKQRNNGTGTKLLQGVIKQASADKCAVYLETSTLKNLPWYEKNGFKIYNELDLGYQLYFLRNE